MGTAGRVTTCMLRSPATLICLLLLANACTHTPTARQEYEAPAHNTLDTVDELMTGIQPDYLF